jgi:hypothetical protein
VGTKAFSNKAGELRAYQREGVWIIDGDVDGDGIADFSLALAGAYTPGVGDFIL